MEHSLSSSRLPQLNGRVQRFNGRIDEGFRVNGPRAAVWVGKHQRVWGTVR